MTDLSAMDYLWYIAALLFTIGLILLLAWALRTLGLAQPLLLARGPARRLRIIEMLPLDARRRLVLVGRDETAHLLLIGGDSDLLIEHNLPSPPASPALPPSPRPV